EAGIGRYLELGPDAVLGAAVAECLEDLRSDARSPDHTMVGPSERTSPDDGPLIACAQRAEDDQAVSLLAFLGRVHADGAEVDWVALHHGARTVDLPTYAFQRERYWLDPVGDGAAGAGLLGAEHPLLESATHVAAENLWLFTG